MKWVWGTVIVIAFILLGGFREIIFVNINEQIEFSEGRKDAYYVLPYLQFLGEWTIAELSTLKWWLTLATMVLNFLLSILALRLVIRRPHAVKWLVLLYLAGFLFAGMTFGLGRLLSEAQLGYTISRAIMGGLQSPFPLMLLIPALVLMSSSAPIPED